MQPQPSSLVVANNQVIPTQCEGVLMARLESPFRAENGLVEPSPEAHPPEGLYIARSLVRDHWEVPVRVLNATWHNQKLTKGSALAKVLLAPGKERCWEMVSAVWHLCSQLRPLIKELGPNASVQHLGPIQNDSHQCSRALSTEWPRKPVPPDRCGLVYQVARSLCHYQPRGFQSGGSISYQLLLALRSTTAATVTRAVTSSLILYRTLSNAWEWARHILCACTCSWTAWSNATSKQLRSTYERLSHGTQGIGMHDYRSSSWLTGHSLTTLWASPRLA
jgi:hypothetical protein